MKMQNRIVLIEEWGETKVGQYPTIHRAIQPTWSVVYIGDNNHFRSRMTNKVMAHNPANTSLNCV